MRGAGNGPHHPGCPRVEARPLNGGAAPPGSVQHWAASLAGGRPGAQTLSLKGSYRLLTGLIGLIGFLYPPWSLNFPFCIMKGFGELTSEIQHGFTICLLLFFFGKVDRASPSTNTVGDGKDRTRTKAVSRGGWCSETLGSRCFISHRTVSVRYSF